eukprot:TRINITY_DN9993_c0_g1_i1.p1 TRINITY_DN9993_c0_g1~~TRINITY_DN9993_c0_g1_i1.p1  ORF type:complete len:533 (+),score=50.68 TRINITY_DN9993_c0_g1_i1:92-1690(+)
MMLPHPPGQQPPRPWSARAGGRDAGRRQQLPACRPRTSDPAPPPVPVSYRGCSPPRGGRRARGAKTATPRGQTPSTLGPSPAYGTPPPVPLHSCPPYAFPHPDVRTGTPVELGRLSPWQTGGERSRPPAPPHRPLGAVAHRPLKHKRRGSRRELQAKALMDSYVRYSLSPFVAPFLLSPKTRRRLRLSWPLYGGPPDVRPCMVPYPVPAAPPMACCCGMRGACYCGGRPVPAPPAAPLGGADADADPGAQPPEPSGAALAAALPVRLWTLETAEGAQRRSMADFEAVGRASLSWFAAHSPPPPPPSGSRTPRRAAPRAHSPPARASPSSAAPTPRAARRRLLQLSAACSALGRAAGEALQGRYFRRWLAQQRRSDAVSPLGSTSRAEVSPLLSSSTVSLPDARSRPRRASLAPVEAVDGHSAAVSRRSNSPRLSELLPRRGLARAREALAAIVGAPGASPERGAGGASELRGLTALCAAWARAASPGIGGSPGRSPGSQSSIRELRAQRRNQGRSSVHGALAGKHTLTVGGA